MDLPKFATYYAEPGREPLRSVMTGGEVKAFEVAAQLAPNSRAERNRFGGDFGHYYPERVRVERWLYEAFIAQGGRPEVHHPVYYVVGESSYLQTWMGDALAYHIALETQDYMSVTLGDSMGVGPERLGRVYTLDQFRAWLAPFADLDAAKRSLPYQFSYFEVQVWCSAPEVTLDLVRPDDLKD